MRIRGLIVLSLAVLSAELFAQGKLTFRSESNYVEVDAIVTDSRGATVRGLTPADFVLKEDRKPQAIDAFDFVDLSAKTPTTAGFDPRYRPGLPDDLRVASGRVYLLYLDAAEASDVSRLREQATQFVQDFLLPNDVAAVWSADSTTGEVVFTNDKATLMKPIAAYTGTSSGGIRPTDMAAASQRQMVDAVGWLSSIQGRRKSLLLFMTSFSTSSRVCLLSLYGYPASGGLMVRHGGEEFRSGSDGSNCMTDPAAVATKADVHVYGIDTSGLVAPWSAAQSDFDLDEPIANLAEATGGLALINRNSYKQGFERIVQDNSQYYVLGYDSSAGENAVKSHEISVSVNSKGLTVRARKGYVAQ